MITKCLNLFRIGKQKKLEKIRFNYFTDFWMKILQPGVQGETQNCNKYKKEKSKKNMILSKKE